MSTEPLSDNEYLFTSESVTEGHPDKMADQISDGVLDAVMRDDPTGRVACETLVNTGLVVVSGEISTETYVDIPAVARETIRRIGYTDADLGFSADSCAVINAIDKQSPDIAQGVDQANEARTSGSTDELDLAGAGDQGMMFGYAPTRRRTSCRRRSPTRTSSRRAWPRCARTRPRWTAAPPMPRGTSPRTSWRPAWPTAPRCRSPTPSASHARCRSWSRRSARRRSAAAGSRSSSTSSSTCARAPSARSSSCI